MSVNYSTYVVVGFDVADVIKIHKEVSYQRKYDANTGIPYSVEKTSEKIYLGSAEITGVSLEDCVSWLIPGMEVYQADLCEKNGKIVIGIPITKLDTPCISELQLIQLETTRQQVKLEMRKNLEIDIEPAVFVVFRCSY
jgi:hypothetical protein